MPLRQEYYYEEDYMTPQRMPKNKGKEDPKAKNKVKNKKKKKVAIGILSFAVALAIVYRYAMINNANMEVINLKKEYESIDKTNTQLMLAAERSVDLKEVERYATEELGLQKPQSYQIEYINLNKQDFINNQQTIENKNWIETVILNIVEFFN